jgi:hypothetical protein
MAAKLESVLQLRMATPLNSLSFLKEFFNQVSPFVLSRVEIGRVQSIVSWGNHGLDSGLL